MTVAGTIHFARGGIAVRFANKRTNVDFHAKRKT